MFHFILKLFKAINIKTIGVIDYSSKCLTITTDWPNAVPLSSFLVHRGLPEYIFWCFK